MEKIWNGSLCETRGQLILDYFNTEYEPLFEEVPNHYAQPWFMSMKQRKYKKNISHKVVNQVRTKLVLN